MCYICTLMQSMSAMPASYRTNRLSGTIFCVYRLYNIDPCLVTAHTYDAQ